MPECYLTELTWTINARSLQNFLTLRTSKHALWEIQELSLCIYEALPQEHKYLFEKCVENSKGDGDV
ncbi:FAD-dependent thymidylate synthase [Helicobacter canis]|nr:FAD-dependent thymidylate synthase [Helicobacter canis]